MLEPSSLGQFWRRSRQIFIIALALFVWRSAGAETNALRPNIVIILADDLGYSDLGCFGSEISTPNLDRLAANGIRLTQFYTTPRCCPTRAALLTGLYPQQAGMGGMMEDRGVPGYRGELKKNCPTIAEQLREARYRTLMVGKWHLNHIHFNGKQQLNFESSEPFWENKNGWPLQRGFDEFFGTIHGVCSYYDPFSLASGNRVTKPDSKAFYYTDVISDRAASYITGNANTNQPFFLFVSYTAPHWPLQAPEADIAKYRSTYMAGWDQIRTNRYRRQIELGLIDQHWSLSPRDPRVTPWGAAHDKAWEANRMATYAAMVEHLDQGVGRIVETLKTSGIEKNTLVIFFSDNGACAEVVEPAWYDIPTRLRDGRPVKIGNKNHSVLAGPDDVWQSYGIEWANVSDTPFLLYKHFTHEGGIATPFIASWPIVIKSRGGMSAETAHVTDIMATCVELAGARRPTSFQGERVPPLEGVSLVPIFEGKEPPHPAPIFWEHEGNRAVRLGKWKLVSRNRREWELYDMEVDRTESKNLAGQQTEKVSDMAALYNAWARRCDVLPLNQLPPSRPTIPAKLENSPTSTSGDSGGKDR
jgi:arylsulfatase